MTYSYNEDVEQIPKIGEIFDEAKCKEFDEELQCKNDGEKVVAVWKEHLKAFSLG